MPVEKRNDGKHSTKAGFLPRSGFLHRSIFDIPLPVCADRVHTGVLRRPSRAETGVQTDSSGASAEAVAPGSEAAAGGEPAGATGRKKLTMALTSNYFSPVGFLSKCYFIIKNGCNFDEILQSTDLN